MTLDRTIVAARVSAPRGSLGNAPASVHSALRPRVRAATPPHRPPGNNKRLPNGRAPSRRPGIDVPTLPSALAPPQVDPSAGSKCPACTDTGEAPDQATLPVDTRRRLVQRARHSPASRRAPRTERPTSGRGESPERAGLPLQPSQNPVRPRPPLPPLRRKPIRQAGRPAPLPPDRSRRCPLQSKCRRIAARPEPLLATRSEVMSGRQVATSPSNPTRLDASHAYYRLECPLPASMGGGRSQEKRQQPTIQTRGPIGMRSGRCMCLSYP